MCSDDDDDDDDGGGGGDGDGDADDDADDDDDIDDAAAAAAADDMLCSTSDALHRQVDVLGEGRGGTRSGDQKSISVPALPSVLTLPWCMVYGGTFMLCSVAGHSVCAVWQGIQIVQGGRSLGVQSSRSGSVVDQRRMRSILSVAYVISNSSGRTHHQTLLTAAAETSHSDSRGSAPVPNILRKCGEHAASNSW